MTHHDMLNQATAALRLLAREAWKRDHVRLTIVEELGDMPFIPVNAFQIVADPHSGTFDIWAHEPYELVKPDLTMDALLDLLPMKEGAR